MLATKDPAASLEAALPSPELRLLRAYGLGTVFALTVLWLAAQFLAFEPQLGLQRVGAQLTPMAGPSVDHLLGTDQLGRDLLLRLVASVDSFYLPGLFAALVVLFLSVPAGTLLGYRDGGLLALVVSFLLTTLSSWPRLVLVVVGVAMFTAMVSDPAAWEEQRLFMLGGLVGLSYVPDLARALAARLRSLRQQSFVEACRAHGLSERSILLRHMLLTNCWRIVLRHCCLVFGAFLLVETSLSYLGDYGVPPPRPSWGNMLAGVKSSVLTSRGLIFGADSSLSDGLFLAVNQGGLLAVLAPSLAIILSIGGLLALAEYLARRDWR